MRQTILKTENIDKYFYDPIEFQVLKNISFEVQKGEFLSMVGKSGSGKSTLLYVLSTMDTEYKGNLFIDNELMTGLSTDKLAAIRNEKIGFVFQFHYLLSEFTCLKNVMIPAIKLGKYSEKEIEEKAYEKLKILGLEDQALKPANKLSGGQQQRVAIARALVKNPDVLLLDEPLSNLDARLRLQTREEIKRIQRETGITTIFVTHDQEEAMSISDEIIVMKDGVAQQKGAPQEVYNNPVNLFVAKFLGTPPINVFKGYIKDGGVYIGEDRILETELPEQEVTIGIRPEGFEVNEDGTGDFTFKINLVEYIGRDKSVVAENEYCESPTFRFIVDADIKNIVDGRVIKAKIKPHKCFIFDKLTEKRLQ